jgi:hypothetical protein
LRRVVIRIGLVHHTPVGDIIYQAFKEAGVVLPEPIVLPGTSSTAYRIASEINAVAIIDELSLLNADSEDTLIKELSPEIRLPIQIFTSKTRNLSHEGTEFIRIFKENLGPLGFPKA